MNSFPSDFNSNLTGFGGDAAKNRAQHRAEIKKTPVILVHGNAGNSVHPQWGMQPMKNFLKGASYQDSEIWAMDYLGENNTNQDTNDVHVHHIDALRIFVDRVKDYLGVDKLDFITHSLGCGMVNGYLRGLQSNGEWNNADNRFGVVSTFVVLAGATYGLGPNARTGSLNEFQTGSSFEVNSHIFNDITDDTPLGANTVSEEIAPVESWKKTTPLDTNAVRYVAFIATGDFVDQQNQDTSRREGADLNERFNLGPSIIGHEQIIKNQTVFDAFNPYLNQHPPQPPVRISIDKDSGNYGSNLPITVTVDPPTVSVDYTAERMTSAFQAGFLVRTIADTRTGTLSNGQSVTLAPDGAWEVTFSARGADKVVRTYGVNAVLPEVTILTDNSTSFQGSLAVMASATKGILYHSFDGQHWTAGSVVTITQTATISFIAIDSNGLASAIVSRGFEKKPTCETRATGTLTEHFNAGRLTVNQYVELGLALGFTAVITLCFINGQWVYNPETAERGTQAPVVHVSVDSGTHMSPITVVLRAQDKVDAAPKIFYTLDSSVPTESSPSFLSSGLLTFDTAGTKVLSSRARNASGNWSEVVTKTYTLNIQDAQPKIRADKPNGEYAEGFEVGISASDDVDASVPVYYTEDGSDPADEKNPNRRSFVDSKSFAIQGKGNHSVLCYAKDSAGKETVQAFAWSIDDQD